MTLAISLFVVKEIERINAKEIDLLVSRGLDAGGSWHDEHKDSAYVFIGGLPFEASEGDVITVFSQYGEVLDINLIRDEKTGKSKGFAFLAYQDQRSTVLAVDNLNGIKLADRTLRVDHVKNYKPPSRKDENGNKITDLSFNAAPQPIEEESMDEKEQSDVELGDDAIMAANGIDPEDPMASFLLEKAKKALKKDKKKKKPKKDKKEKSSKKHKSKDKVIPYDTKDERGRSREDTRPVYENRDSRRGTSPSWRKHSALPSGHWSNFRKSVSPVSHPTEDSHRKRYSSRSRSPRRESRR